MASAGGGSTILDYLIRVRGGQQGQRELQKLSSGLNTFTGRMQAALALAALLGPALISVASSATMAGGAAATVGVAGFVALTTAMAGTGIVAGQLFGQLGEAMKAQEQLNMVIAQYGENSQEATDAWIKFNAVLAENGGANTLRLLERLNAVTDTWTKRTGAARRAMTSTFGAGLTAAMALLPRFTRLTNRASEEVRDGLTASFREMSGSEGRRNLSLFGSTGIRMIQPIIRGLTDLGFAVMRFLRPALPYALDIVRAFEDWAHGIRAASSDSSRMQRIVMTMVGHFRSWWALIKAVGTTLKILFLGSADTGQDLVNSLTRVVTRMNEWLEAARQSGRMRQFFDDNADAVRSLLTAAARLAVLLGTLAAALMPALESGGEGLTTVIEFLMLRIQLLTDVLETLGPLVGPLVIGFIAWKVAIVAITIAQTAWTAAIWLWNAALLANPIVLIIVGIVALVAAIVLAYHKFEWFRNFVDGVWDGILGAAKAAWAWIKENWTKLLPILTGPFGLVLKAIVENFGAIKDAFRDAINWVITRWNNFSVGMGPKKIAGQTVIPGFRLDTPDIPLLAEGGNVRQRGAAIVGDAGPELLELPEGARVTPLAGPNAPMWGGGDIVLKVGPRELARVTRDEVRSQMARGG